MFSIRMDGFDELRRKLERLKENAESIDGARHVKVAELLNRRFMTARTRFSNLDEMISASGMSDEEFLEQQERRDTFIKDNSNFNSWDEMIQKASVEWASDKLFSGIQ